MHVTFAAGWQPWLGCFTVAAGVIAACDAAFFGPVEHLGRPKLGWRRGLLFTALAAFAIYLFARNEIGYVYLLVGVANLGNLRSRACGPLDLPRAASSMLASAIFFLLCAQWFLPRVHQLEIASGVLVVALALLLVLPASVRAGRAARQR